jgi:hypothetical protein
MLLCPADSFAQIHHDSQQYPFPKKIHALKAAFLMYIPEDKVVSDQLIDNALQQDMNEAWELLTLQHRGVNVDKTPLDEPRFFKRHIYNDSETPDEYIPGIKTKKLARHSSGARYSMRLEYLHVYAQNSR